MKRFLQLFLKIHKFSSHGNPVYRPFASQPAIALGILVNSGFPQRVSLFTESHKHGRTETKLIRIGYFVNVQTKSKIFKWNDKVAVDVSSPVRGETQSVRCPTRIPTTDPSQLNFFFHVVNFLKSNESSISFP